MPVLQQMEARRARKPVPLVFTTKKNRTWLRFLLQKNHLEAVHEVIRQRNRRGLFIVGNCLYSAEK
jgi:hypothetical protein